MRRNWGISTILSFPTNSGTVWFKYVPAIFAHEGAVTSILATIVPDNLPRILAWDTGWMLMSEFPTWDHPPCEHPLATLARIQLASADHLADLAAANCQPQPLDALVANFAEFERCFELLTRDQARRLRSSFRHVSDACTEMTALHIPTTVVHGDFYASNAHWGPLGWIIYDWTDSFLGNPFIDVTYAVARREAGAMEAFRRVWLEVLPSETVARALDLGLVIGAAYHIVMHERLMEVLNDPEGVRTSLDAWLKRLSD